MSTRFVTISLDLEVDALSVDHTIAVEVELGLSVESNYGADADGNRGEEYIFVDEIIINTIDGVSFKRFPTSIQDIILDAVSKEVDRLDVSELLS